MVGVGEGDRKRIEETARCFLKGNIMLPEVCPRSSHSNVIRAEFNSSLGATAGYWEVGPKRPCRKSPLPSRLGFAKFPARTWTHRTRQILAARSRQAPILAPVSGPERLVSVV